MTAVFAHRGCTEGFVENTLEAVAEELARAIGTGRPLTVVPNADALWAWCATTAD